MPKARSIPSLTGVRGIAALWVFMTHFYGLAADILHQPWMLQSLFLFNGFRGVDLFFVLSGFILMHVHEGQFTVLRWHVIRDFFIVRFFRVYPLNTFVAAGHGAACAAGARLCGHAAALYGPCLRLPRA
ncbi:acyltransferase family protein [Komagataeibacter intermedius]|uniref:acyltransferase family protein n=1 Tax=Komagataeibacter intermedius TaxID=66229 RepID=UPI0040354F40